MSITSITQAAPLLVAQQVVVDQFGRVVGQVAPSGLEAIFGSAASGVVEIAAALFLLVVFITAFQMIVMPRYNVWAAHKAGEADLAQAMNEQQVQVAAAQGRLKAAESNKAAAIIEAEAVSEQIKRIGENLRTHDLYLRWQWIKMMEEIDTKQTVVYVPTEANLPILEAGRATPHGRS